jgi:hypothetical protein
MCDGTSSKARPSFLITIDTEGDNLWSRPTKVTTDNASCLPRFQRLCESYGFKPTYLTNHEMAICPNFQSFGRDVLKRRTAEIGMHLHAWDSPPLNPLTSDDVAFHPYLVEFPEDVMRSKIRYMTSLLETIFQTKITSHRAGRWSFNETYARILVEQGYLVDCSVTPHVSWRSHTGDPNQSGGADYTQFLDSPYLIDLADISRPGDSSLMEIPVSVFSFGSRGIRYVRTHLRKGSMLRRVLNRIWPETAWLRPNGRNLPTLIRILERATKSNYDCVEFMLHSSELMPGGSPYFPQHSDIEVLYSNLDGLFRTAAKVFRGATLTDYYHHIYAQLSSASSR